MLLGSQWLICGVVALLFYVPVRIIYVVKFPMGRCDDVYLLAGPLAPFDSHDNIPSCPDDLPPKSEMAGVCPRMFTPVSDAVSANLESLSQWRLLLPVAYSVEFRDFFLGDMYCSTTYSLAVSITTRS